METGMLRYKHSFFTRSVQLESTQSMSGTEADQPEQKSALDIGPDIFDWEEFESPDEEVEKKRQRTVQFLRLAVENFTAQHGEWTFENLLDKIDELAAAIREHEENNGEIEFSGYMAVRALPMVAIFAIQCAQERLPPSQQLLRDQTEDLIFGLAKLLDPNRFYDSVVTITNYVDLLDHSTEAKWTRVLDSNTVGWLRRAAEQTLSTLQERIEAQGYPEDEVEREYMSKQILHLGQVANSRLPFGFNSETEQRWELWDMEFLLDPSGDIRQEKLVTRKAYDYVMRQAHERLNLIESARKSRAQPLSQMQEEEELRALQHYTQIVDSKQLPYGYRPVDSAIEDDRMLGTEF